MDNGDKEDTAKTSDHPANWNGAGSAIRSLEDNYGDAIRAGTLHAHELRQLNPKLYEALCQFFTHNKAKDLLPASFADVMPVDPEAKGGWKSRAAAPAPSPEEALVILLRQRESKRLRQKRWRQGKRNAADEAEGVGAEDKSVDGPHRSNAVPTTRRATQNNCG